MSTTIQSTLVAGIEVDNYLRFAYTAEPQWDPDTGKPIEPKRTLDTVHLFDTELVSLFNVAGYRGLDKSDTWKNSIGEVLTKQYPTRYKLSSISDGSFLGIVITYLITDNENYMTIDIVDINEGINRAKAVFAQMGCKEDVVKLFHCTGYF